MTLGWWIKETVLMILGISWLLFLLYWFIIFIGWLL